LETASKILEAENFHVSKDFASKDLQVVSVIHDFGSYLAQTAPKNQYIKPFGIETDKIGIMVSF